MIDENDRITLIRYRLKQAKENIELVEFLIEANRLTVAVNRIYYGLYYAVTALAIKNHFETSKHARLIGWFNKEFIASNILDKRFGKILRNAFQNRTKGDYDAFVSFDREEINQMHSEMIEFINEIEELIEN
jgi:uncharacterized protein (UPF0332 family)